MRAWLALLFATAIAANEIALNLPCNKELDGLLASDPEGNQSAFLSCVGVGVGDIGFWERKFCPNRMIFDFVNQQCKEEEKRSRKEPLTKFNIAILNNSCARGEQCIGGTVCDLDTLKCLCPFGTHADLDTLSCVTPQQHNVPSQFSAFNGFKQSPFGSSFMGSESFLPNPNFAMSTPNPVYNFNFNSKPPSTPFGSGISGAPEYFKPNPSVFGGSNSFIPNSGGSKPTTLAEPGASCRNGELCTGGSTCAKPLALCLCPGELEERDGECVLPERNNNLKIIKVGVGALCNDLAECDHGSSCVMGRCVCVTPLILQDGICVMQQQVKHVGPGELCDNGELCIRGSVCDTLIPVCVCPPETDLRDGECIRVGHYIPPTPQVYPWVTQSPQPVPTEPSTQNTGYQNNYGQSEQQQQQISNFNNNQNNNQQPNRPQVPVIPYPRQPQTSQQSLAVSPANQPYQPPRTPVTVQTIETPFQPYQTAAPPTQRPPQPPQPPIRTQPPPIRTQPPTRPYTPTYETQTPTRRPLNIPTTTPQSYRSINNPSPPNVKPNIVKLGGSKQSGVGVRCALNTDCMIGAYCNGNTNPPTCQCLSTHVNVDSRCEKVIYPGQAGCQSDSQCSAAYTGTSCIDRVCICPAGNKAVDQTCVPGSAQTCTATKDCPITLHCMHQYCLCPDTTVLHYGKCVLPSKLTCTTSLECPYGMQCANEKCKCLSGILIHGMCFISDNESQSKKQKRQFNSYASILDVPFSHTAIIVVEEGVLLSLNEPPTNRRKKVLAKQNPISGYKRSIVKRQVSEGNFYKGSESPESSNLVLDPVEASVLNQDIHKSYAKLLSKLEMPNPEEDPTEVNLRRSLHNEPQTIELMDDVTDLLYKIDSNPDVIAELRNKRQQSAADSMVCWPGAEHCANKKGVCINGACHCINGYEERDGQCVPKYLKVGASCQSELQDSEATEYKCGPNTECIQGVCVCVTGNCSGSKPVKLGKDKYCAEGTKYKHGKCVDAPGAYKSVGDACAIKDRCSGGSICLNESCQCVNGSTERIGKCVQSPSGRCLHGESCQGDSVCDLGVCKCPQGTSLKDDRCHTVHAPPGASCQAGQKCVNGSVCRFGVCMCTAKNFAMNGQCIPKQTAIAVKQPAPISTRIRNGAVQSTTTQTSIQTTTLTTLTTITSTTTTVSTTQQPTTQPTTTHTVQKEERNPGSQCELENHQCTGGASCIDGYCICRENEVIINGECAGSVDQATELIRNVNVSAPGQKCDDATKCTGGSECIERVCACPLGTTTSYGECNESVEPAAVSDGLVAGIECKLNMECPHRTECIRGVCRCKKGETIVNGICRQAIHEVLPGGKCDSKKGYDCVGEAHCHYGVCVCLRPLISFGSECVPQSTLQVVEPGSACDLHSICGGGSQCIKGICLCAADHVKDVNKKCVPKSMVYPVFHKIRASTEEVPVLLSATQNQERVREVMDKAKILPTVGDPCDDYCRDGATCTLGFCQCIGEFFNYNGRCLHKSEANNMFEKQIRGNEFRPPTEFQPNTLGVITMPPLRPNPVNQAGVNQVLYGHSCYNNSNCPMNSYCFNSLCKCFNGYRAVAGYCETMIPLGGRCASANQCEGDATCTSGVCVCSSASAGSKRCRPSNLAHPGDPCTMDQICSYNSYCSTVSGVCECPSGMVTSEEKCVQTLDTTGNDCMTSRNCHKFSYCDNGFCVCKNEYLLANGFCIPHPHRVTKDDLLDLVKPTLAGGFPANGEQDPRRFANNGPDPMLQERIRADFEQQMAQQTMIREMQSQQTENINFQQMPKSMTQTPMDVEGLFGIPEQPTTAPTTLSLNVQSVHNLPPFSFTAPNSPFPDKPLQINVMPPQGTNQMMLSSGDTNMKTREVISTESESLFEPDVPNLFPNPNGMMPIAYGRQPNKQSGVINKNMNVAMPEDRPSLRSTSQTQDQSGYDTRRTLPTTIAMPGEYCGEDGLCLGNSFCVQSHCRCPKGSFAENGICIRRNHRRPSNGEEEFVENEVDSSDAEVENDNSEDVDERRQFSNPLQSCEQGEFCTGGSNCKTISGLGQLCGCPDNMLAINGECVELPKRAVVAGIGDRCAEGQICLGGGKCLAGACLCDGGKQEVFGICILLSKPGDACLNGEVCAEGSVCSNGSCVCPKGSIPKRDVCVIVSEINGMPGTRCDSDADCIDQAFCSRSRCSCPAGTVVYGKRCVRAEQIKLPTEACGYDSMCVNQSQCVDGYCTCPSGTENRDGSCVKHGTAARREKRTLNRHDNYINEVITSPPGGSCSDERECTGGSVCREGWCICPHHTMIVQKGICVQTQVRPTVPPKVAPVEHHTYTTKQIYTNPPTQPPTTRTPPQTQRPMQLPTKQGRKATPGSKCGPLDVCVGGSMCVEGMCLCPAGSRASDNGRCEAAAATTARPTAAPGEHRTRPVTHSPQQPRRPTPASIEVTLTPNPGQSDLDYDDSECRAVGLICRGNTICVNRSCQCPVGHLLLGDACVPPGQAISRNKANRKGKSWSQAGSASAKYSRPGEDCSEGEMCTGGSHCGEGLQPFTKSCVCPADKPVIRGDFCAAEQTINAGAGQQCSHGVRCIGGSTCVSGWCRCANGMMAFNGECVPRPTSPPTVTVPPTTAQVQTIAPRYSAPHNPCDNGETCTGGSRCDDDTGMCMCHSGQIVMGTQCAYPPTTAPAPKAECSDNSHCRDNRMCVSGRCKCRPGYVDNMGRCDPLEAPSTPKVHQFGQACVEGVDLCAAGFQCVNGFCQCQEGYRLNQHGMCIKVLEEKPLSTSGPRPHAPKMPETPRTVQIPSASELNTMRPQTHPKANGRSFGYTASPQSIGSIKEAHNYNTNQKPYSQPNIPTALPPVIISETTTHIDITDMKPSASQEPLTMSSYQSRAIKFGSKCTVYDDCMKGSECIRGKCRCPPTTQLEKGECVKEHRTDISYPGDSCAMGQLCVGGSVCDNDSRMCICAAGHVQAGKRCNNKDAPQFSNPGERCSRSGQCAGGSECHMGKCRCDEFHFASNGYCRPIDAANSDVRMDGNGLRFSSKQVPQRPIAQFCDLRNCHLPNCFCSVSGRTPPAGLSPDQIPQLVVITLDDSVNGKTMPDYMRMFETTRWRNPNNCPVKATFFISHEWTNYDSVQWIQRQGHELASNSIAHVSLEHENTQRWLSEMDGQRRILSKFGGADEADIVGMRAPQLALGSDAQFEMMLRAGFLYDNSMTTNPGIHGAPFWPQTMDYKSAFPCTDNNCPTRSFPGIWEVPINQFHGNYMKQLDSYRRASMIRAATHLNATEHELFQLLMSNFDRAYTTNKAPYVLTLNADFLHLNNTEKGIQAFERFMDETSKLKDVYFVTMKQLIEWMKKPTTLADADKSEALRCRVTLRDHSKTTCDKPNKCRYRTPNLSSQEHQFTTCSPCPAVYPWLENPVGVI